MKDIFLTHYYYGNRLTSFKAGLGTIIRAKGHLLNTQAILITESSQWVTDQNQFKDLNVVLLDLNKNKNIIDVLRKTVLSSENTVLLIANFDLLIIHTIMTLGDFIDIIKNKHRTTEILLTGEMRYDELEEVADYVSKHSTI